MFVPSKICRRQRGEGRSGGRLKPDVKVTIGGDPPPRLGGHVFTFADMPEFLVVYLEYELLIRVANEDGRDMVLARRRELVDLATQMMVAEEFNNRKVWIDLSEQELKKRLETFAGVDMKETSDVEFSRQIIRVLKTHLSVPVGSMVFMQKRALLNHLTDSGLSYVVKRGGRQTKRRVLVEAIAAEIEPFLLRRKVVRETRFTLVLHDLEAPFHIIDQQ